MKNSFLIIILFLVTIVLGFISKELLDTNRVLVDSLAEQLTREQIQNILNIQEKWQWVSYLLIPIILLLKISSVIDMVKVIPRISIVLGKLSSLSCL